MENIGNMNEITKEVQHFYPHKIHGAIGYIETKYNLDIYHATHLASVAWQTLNHQYPWNLPELAAYLPHMNWN
jgi:hypothetical protein